MCHIRSAAVRGRSGLVFKAHSLFVSLNSGLESNKEEEGQGADHDFDAAVAVADDRLEHCRIAIGTVLNLRTTTSQKCEAVPRRARI